MLGFNMVGDFLRDVLESPPVAQGACRAGSGTLDPAEDRQAHRRDRHHGGSEHDGGGRVAHHVTHEAGGGIPGGGLRKSRESQAQLTAPSEIPCYPCVARRAAPSSALTREIGTARIPRDSGYVSRPVWITSIESRPRS